MTEDLARKRARDLARYHARKAAGTWTHYQPSTPEQQDRYRARQERALQWREVRRAFERVVALPPDVLTEAVRRVNAKGTP